MGGSRAAHGEAEGVTMPAGCDPPGEATDWRSRPSIHSSPPAGITLALFGRSPRWVSVSLSTKWKSLDWEGSWLFWETEPGVNWGRLDQWVKQTNKGKFKGKRFNILDTGSKLLCQEVREESWTSRSRWEWMLDILVTSKGRDEDSWIASVNTGRLSRNVLRTRAWKSYWLDQCWRPGFCLGPHS